MVNKARMKGKGEGKTHIKMTDYVVDVMIDLGYIDVRPRYPIQFRNPKSDNEFIASKYGWYHEVDVHGAQIFHNGIGDLLYYITYVEIDGEAHRSKIQQNKDKTSMQMIKEYHEANPDRRGGFRIIRLKKELVLEAMKLKKAGPIKDKIRPVIQTGWLSRSKPEVE